MDRTIARAVEAAGDEARLTALVRALRRAGIGRVDWHFFYAERRADAAAVGERGDSQPPPPPRPAGVTLVPADVRSVLRGVYNPSNA